MIGSSDAITLNGAMETIRRLRAELDRLRNKRIAALEDENERMREALRTGNAFLEAWVNASVSDEEGLLAAVDDAAVEFGHALAAAVAPARKEGKCTCPAGSYDYPNAVHESYCIETIRAAIREQT